MKTTPIPVKFDRQGHSCNFFAGFGPTVAIVRAMLVDRFARGGACVDGGIQDMPDRLDVRGANCVSLRYCAIAISWRVGVAILGGRRVWDVQSARC